MTYHSIFRSHLTALAASAVLTTAAFTLVPASRAQSPEPSASPAEHDQAADIFEAVKKGADKLQKQAKEAQKIGPELKQLQDRQAEYIKHQLEVERHLGEILTQQSAELHQLSEAVERMESELKAVHPAAAATAATPAATLPATEPAASPTP